MDRSTDERIIFSPTAVLAAVFTVVAATDIITSNAHGLSEGDCLQLTTATTLPTGLSLLTNYYVINPTTNTFQLSATPHGTTVDITDTGTGAHTFHLEGKVIYIGDYKHNVLHLTFSSTPTMTVKVQGGIPDSAPNFNVAQSITNKWDYVEVIDLQDGAAIDGDTGIACTGTADNRILEINVNGLTWATVSVTAFTAGKLGISIKSYRQ